MRDRDAGLKAGSRTLKAVAIGLLLAAALHAQPLPPDLVLLNARLARIDGRPPALTDIVIQAGRIDRLEVRGGEGPRATAARVVDLAGRTVAPGLIDAHVTPSLPSLEAWLRAGVTTVRLLGRSADRVRAGAAGPRVLSSGPPIDGRDTAFADAMRSGFLLDLGQLVRVLADRDVDVIVAGPALDAAALTLIAAEARARGVPVAALLAPGLARAAARAGVGSIEQLTGIVARTGAAATFDSAAWWMADARAWVATPGPELDETARRLAEARVTIVPALAWHEALARMARGDPTLVPGTGSGEPHGTTAFAAAIAQAPAEDRRALADSLIVKQRFVGMVARHGGRVVAGSAAPAPGLAAGAGYARELQLLAGILGPGRALRAATADAAALLGIASDAGAIAPGRDADLVVFDGDPLRDPTVLGCVWMVLRRGAVIDAAR